MDEDKIFKRQELSVYRRVRQIHLYRFLRVFVEGFSAGKIEMIARFFSQLPAIIYILALIALLFEWKKEFKTAKKVSFLSYQEVVIKVVTKDKH